MAPRTPSPGIVVDNKYRLAERIGGGGMGYVFRAENVLAGRAVAIKFLHPELSENSELAQRFFQEAQAVNKIRHPNIVDVIDAGVGEFGPYIVMEHLEGEGVGSALTRLGRFDMECSLSTAIPVLEALDAAHRVGIIHRDLKPENVFIAMDVGRQIAVVRLLDFGIAKVLDSNGPSPRTRTGVVFGTPDYLSPEQATGESPLDGRSDLFAVGVLLYELLTGTRPFRAPTAVATAFRVVHAEAPTLSAAGVHVDPRLEGVVQRLLQKEPARRYATAGDVVRDLDRLAPDPTRRSAALGRIIGISRRMPYTATTHPSFPESERVAYPAHPSRESGGAPPPRSRFSMDVPSSGGGIGHAPTRVVPSLPAARVSEPGSTLRPGETLAARMGTASDPRPVEASVPLRSAAEPAALRMQPRPLGALRVGPASRVTPVRPLPTRFAGLYQVRGAVLRSIDKALIEDSGARIRDQVVSQMPERYAADFLNDSINALVAYELEALDAYIEIAASVAVHESSRWRALGRLAVGGELHNAVRSVLRPAPDMQIAIRRGISIWSRLFSFGAWRVAPGVSGRVSLHISEFDPASHALRLWVVGMVEETVRRAMTSEVKVTIVGGEPGFSPEILCDIM
jgi:serine/threonine-protein kinase